MAGQSFSNRNAARWQIIRYSEAGTPVATLWAGFCAEMVFRVHITAAHPLMLRAIRGNHLVAVVLDHHLPCDTLVLKVITLAPEALLLHLLQLYLDGTRARAAALPLRSTSGVDACMLAAAEVVRVRVCDGMEVVPWACPCTQRAQLHSKLTVFTGR